MSRTYHSATMTVTPQGDPPGTGTARPVGNRPGTAAAAGIARTETTAVTPMVEFDAPRPADFDHTPGMDDGAGHPLDARGGPGGLLGILRRRARWIGLRLRTRQ